MCGISGYLTRQKRPDLAASLAAMRHRGPDASGVHEAALGDFLVGFGHVRLSILDLSTAANQPFISPCGNYVLVFNGEIYNHDELRQRLQKLGTTFRTRSDTEVLLHACITWGAACVAQLDGMFAFALLDIARRQVFCARDPFGIKPFYFRHHHATGEFRFASEIRGLACLSDAPLLPDAACFGEFLLNGFLYEPRTGIAGVEKLGAGETLTINLQDGSAVRHRYDDPLSPMMAAGDTEAALRTALALQVLADVPVGLFFSGGIDSSVLAALAPHPLHGLFMDYRSAAGAPASGDAAYATDIAEKLKLHLEIVPHASGVNSREAILASFQGVARGNEEPISDYTYAAAEELSLRARQRGYKVMLSGMGGDELFAGYPRHLMARWRTAARACASPLQFAAPWLQRHPRLAKKTDRLSRYAAEPDFLRAYTSLIGYFSVAEVSRLLGKTSATENFFTWLDTQQQRISHLSFLKQAMYLDRYGFLAHNLTVTDRASMAHGIEVRVPLLTPQLAAQGFASVDGQLLGLRGGKRPLRKMLNRHLPAALFNRRKEGFNPPLEDKIATLGKDCILAHLAAGPLAATVDMALVTTLVHSHFSGQRNETYKLWQLLYFNEWLTTAGTTD